MAKLTIRAVGEGVLGSKGEVLANIELRREVPHEDMDFVRAKLELLFADLHSQEVEVKYDFELAAQQPGLMFQPRQGAEYHFMQNYDGVQTVLIGQSEEPKSMLSKLTRQQREALDNWATSQPRNQSGSLDLMRWPGWADALQTRIQNKS